MKRGALDKPSSHLANLTIRVELEGARPQEVFLQHGLSIGRNASNAIAINDPVVARIHARVLRQPDGSLHLVCDEQDTTDIGLPDGTRTRLLALQPGTKFRIGPALLTCDQRATPPTTVVADNPWQATCPRCRSRLSDLMTDADARCPACGQGIFYYGRASEGADADQFRGWLPRKVGPYRVRAFVAQGGMGVVLRGLHEEKDIPAAIKLLRVDSDPAWRERFAAEVDTLKRLEHPNVVTLLDHGEDQRLMWLATDWIEGQSLAHLIDQANQKHQTIPLLEIQETMRRIRDGLEYLHSLGVMHRDLKPANVLIARDRAVKIVDVGIAKTIGASTRTTATQTGALLGTASYIAPEQLEGSTGGIASDIYCFGLIWYEMLTGKPPALSFRAPGQRRPETPSAWNSAILKCLSADARGRPSLKELDVILKAKITKPFTRKDFFELTRALAALVLMGAIFIAGAGAALWGLAKAQDAVRYYGIKLWHKIFHVDPPPKPKPHPAPLFRVDGLLPIPEHQNGHGSMIDPSKYSNAASTLRASLDFSAALDRAGSGDVAAMMDVANRYAQGTDGAPLDQKSARRWQEAAAEKGSVAAMFALADADKRDAEDAAVDMSARSAAAKTAESWYLRVIKTDHVSIGDYVIAQEKRAELHKGFSTLFPDQSKTADITSPGTGLRP